MNHPPDAPETRERILDVAVDLLRTGKAPSMAEVARVAGVSRQTLYLHFGDRAGLFADIVTFLTTRDAALPRLGSTLHLPAREAFEQHFRNWIQLAAQIEPYMRHLWPALTADRDLLDGVRDRDRYFGEIYRKLFEKLAQEGLLRPAWTVQEAAEAAWSMSLYLLTIGHMQAMNRWSVDDITERQLKLLREAFLIDAPD